MAINRYVELLGVYGGPAQGPPRTRKLLVDVERIITVREDDDVSIGGCDLKTCNLVIECGQRTIVERVAVSFDELTDLIEGIRNGI